MEIGSESGGRASWRSLASARELGILDVTGRQEDGI